MEGVYGFGFAAPLDGAAGGRRSVQADIDVGLREYMLRIYNYMASGFALTGIVAYVFANSGYYAQVAQTPLIWLIMLAPLGFVMVMSFGIQRMQASTAAAAVLGVRRGHGAVAGLDIPGVHRRQHRARVLHHRRHVRGDEPLRLHDEARSDASSARS